MEMEWCFCVEQPDGAGCFFLLYLRLVQRIQLWYEWNKIIICMSNNNSNHSSHPRIEMERCFCEEQPDADGWFFFINEISAENIIMVWMKWNYNMHE